MIRLEGKEFQNLHTYFGAEANELLDEMTKVGAEEGEITIKIHIGMRDHDKQISGGGEVVDTWVPDIGWTIKSAAKIKHEACEGAVETDGYLTKKGMFWEITDGDEMVLIHD